MYGLDAYTGLAYAQAPNETNIPPIPPVQLWQLIDDSQTGNWVIINNEQ